MKREKKISYFDFEQVVNNIIVWWWTGIIFDVPHLWLWCKLQHAQPEAPVGRWCDRLRRVTSGSPPQMSRSSLSPRERSLAAVTQSWNCSGIVARSFCREAAAMAGGWDWALEEQLLPLLPLCRSLLLRLSAQCSVCTILTFYVSDSVRWSGHFMGLVDWGCDRDLPGGVDLAREDWWRICRLQYGWFSQVR